MVISKHRKNCYVSLPLCSYELASVVVFHWYCLRYFHPKRKGKTACEWFVSSGFVWSVSNPSPRERCYTANVTGLATKRVTKIHKQTNTKKKNRAYISTYIMIIAITKTNKITPTAGKKIKRGYDGDANEYDKNIYFASATRSRTLQVD